jgi:hypothetical protein
MACSPFSNAVFCHDSRFSCPASSTCSSDAAFVQNTCVASDGSVIGDAAMNVDAMAVAEFHDYGEHTCSAALFTCVFCILVLFVAEKALCDSYASGNGMVEVKSAVGLCSAITPKIPSFCSCIPSNNGANIGAMVTCPTLNVPGGATFGASAHFSPCGSAASFGFSAWTREKTLVNQRWPGTFNANLPLDRISLGLVSFNFRAELGVAIANNRITAKVALGACFSGGIGHPACCNQQCTAPAALKVVASKLPFTVFTGVYDFTALCIR